MLEVIYGNAAKACEKEVEALLAGLLII